MNINTPEKICSICGEWFDSYGDPVCSHCRGVKKQKILRNMIRCKNCNTVIESKHVHDYQECKCGNVSVDGGREYLKRSFPPNMTPEEAYEDLSNQPEPIPEHLHSDII